MQIRWVHKFLNDVELSSINREMLDRIMTARQAGGVANSTVNRTMEVIRAVLRRAMNEWEWLEKAMRTNATGTQTARSLDHAGAD